MVKCPNCTEDVPESRVQRAYNQYKLYDCAMCRLQFWDPRSLDQDYYQDEETYAYVLFHRGALKLPKWHKWFLQRFLHETSDSPKLLDIGCGNGIFLSEAEDLGYDVHGIDIDAKSISVARQKYELNNVHAMTLERFVDLAKAQGNKFDVITFFEVLEHQPNPVKFLSDVKKLLKPGGKIVGSVPNRDRAYADGDRKNGDDLPPHHFLWLNEEVLRDMFGRLGWNHISFDKLTYSLWEYSAWLQNMYFGFLSNKARSVATKTILKEQKNSGFALLDVIKIARNAVFFPLAILTIPYYIYVNGRGWDVIFTIND